MSTVGTPNHWLYGRNRGKSMQAKIVLNTQNGIFYDCMRDAADAVGLRYKHLSVMLLGKIKNKTNLIYA